MVRTGTVARRGGGSNRTSTVVGRIRPVCRARGQPRWGIRPFRVLPLSGERPDPRDGLVRRIPRPRPRTQPPAGATSWARIVVGS
jgi:hypothetical protein